MQGDLPKASHGKKLIYDFVFEQLLQNGIAGLVNDEKWAILVMMLELTLVSKVSDFPDNTA